MQPLLERWKVLETSHSLSVVFFTRTRIDPNTMPTPPNAAPAKPPPTPDNAAGGMDAAANVTSPELGRADSFPLREETSRQAPLRSRYHRGTSGEFGGGLDNEQHGGCSQGKNGDDIDSNVGLIRDLEGRLYRDYYKMVIENEAVTDIRSMVGCFTCTGYYIARHELHTHHFHPNHAQSCRY